MCKCLRRAPSQDTIKCLLSAAVGGRSAIPATMEYTQLGEPGGICSQALLSTLGASGLGLQALFSECGVSLFVIQALRCHCRVLQFHDKTLKAFQCPHCHPGAPDCVGKAVCMLLSELLNEHWLISKAQKWLVQL